jgi:hypothetical protein
MPHLKGKVVAEASQIIGKVNILWKWQQDLKALNGVYRSIRCSKIKETPTGL